jgi:hypothetical protein
VTPLGKAQQILQQLVDASKGTKVPVPSIRFAQMGGQVVDCESLIVAVAGTDSAADFATMPGCNVPQTANFIVTLARDCAVTFEDNGQTNVKEVERVSAETDRDGEFLWDFAEAYEAYITKTYSLSFINLGGLSIATLSMTLGID